jgi:glycine cleavage system transcriptional repressor
MQTYLMLTLSGRDRVGIVEQVTGRLAALACNVETSRMVHLGGEFAMLMLVAAPDAMISHVEAMVSALNAEGFRASATRTEAPKSQPPGWAMFEISVRGADHEGIIHEVTRQLAGRGINIESMDTSASPAPNSGAPLFAMTALVAAPPAAVTDSAWRDDLERAASRLNVDISTKRVG